MENAQMMLCIVMSTISLLGSAGSVSVLYYRVAQLERRQDKINQSITDHLKLNQEIRETLIEVKRDMHWLRTTFKEKV